MIGADVRKRPSQLGATGWSVWACWLGLTSAAASLGGCGADKQVVVEAPAPAATRLQRQLRRLDIEATTRSVSGGDTLALDVPTRQAPYASRLVDALFSEQDLERGACATSSVLAAFGGGASTAECSHMQRRAEIEAALERFESVVSARLDVAAPLRLGDRVSSAALLLQTLPDGVPDNIESRARAYVAAALNGLDERAVVVEVQPLPAGENAGPSLEKVGPFVVAGGSAGALRVTLIGSQVLHIAAVVALLLVLFRRRKRSEGLSQDASAG